MESVTVAKHNRFACSILALSSVAALLSLSACDNSAAAQNKKSLPASGQDASPTIQLRDGIKAKPDQAKQAPAATKQAAGHATGHPPVKVSNDGRSFVGTLAPSATVKVPAKQTGTLSELRSKAGDYVKQGAVLFRQDSTMSKLQLDQGRKALEVAMIQSRAAARELKRAQTLASGGAAAQVRLDAARTQAELATAGVAQAQAAIALAQQQVNEATMRAPRSGIITRKLMEKGELATLMPPSVVYVLETHDPIEVQVSVPIPSLKHIKPGQAATLIIKDLGVSKKGQVTRISDHVDPRTRSAQIILQAENADRQLKPGMYVDVRLEDTKSI